MVLETNVESMWPRSFTRHRNSIELGDGTGPPVTAADLRAERGRKVIEIDSEFGASLFLDSIIIGIINTTLLFL